MIEDNINFEGARVIADISFYRQTQDPMGRDTTNRRAILLDNGYVIEIDNTGKDGHPIKLLSISDLEERLSGQERMLLNANLLDRNSHQAYADWLKQILGHYSKVTAEH